MIAHDSRTVMEKLDLSESEFRSVFARYFPDDQCDTAPAKHDGWVELKTNPSAAFNVLTGYYNDLGSGPKGISLIDFLIKFGGCVDHRQAMENLENWFRPGIFSNPSSIPPRRPETPSIRRETPKGPFSILSAVQPASTPLVGDGDSAAVARRTARLEKLCETLPGVQLRSFREVYAFHAHLYPNNPDYIVPGVCIPIFGPSLDATLKGNDILGTTLNGLVIMRDDGLLLGRPPKDGKPQDSLKRLSCWGSTAGVIGQVPKLRSARRILIVEGVSDTLATISANTDADRVIVSSSQGASDHSFIEWIAELMKWLEPEITIAGDCDVAGQKGMFTRAKMLLDAGLTKTKIIPSWEPILPKEGADIRNRITKGETLEAILATARPATPAELKRVKERRDPPKNKSKDSKRLPIPSGPAGTTSLFSANGQTETANARRLFESHGSLFRYCHPWGKVLVWDGARWKSDDRGTLKHWATTMAGALWDGLDHLLTPGEDAPREVEEALAFIKKSNTRASINSTIDLACSMPEVTVLPEELDTDPWLLNVQNGTLDLQTGELRPFSPADKITKLCPTEFYPDADATVWEQFIASILPDPEVAQFVQRFLGYSLTGLVTEQILPILWGSGSNGKSTLLNAILDVLGSDYAIKMDKKLIANRGPAGHSTELMDLFGKRFVISSETEDGEKLAESAIKDLTGGEVIRGRRMREDTWEYKPTAKIVLATNHLPEIGGTDHAIWRRIRNVAFGQQFVRPEDATEGQPVIDPELGKKLAAIRPGILAWMVRGCLDWQTHGLPAPAAIVASTNDYRSDQDRLAAFLEERCIRLPACKVRASAAYAAYKKWSESGGEDPVSVKTFGTRMKSIFKHYQSDGVWYRGVDIKVERDDAPEHHENTSVF